MFGSIDGKWLACFSGSRKTGQSGRGGDVKVCIPVMVIKATFTLKYIMLGKNIQVIRHHGITRSSIMCSDNSWVRDF